MLGVETEVQWLRSQEEAVRPLGHQGVVGQVACGSWSSLLVLDRRLLTVLEGAPAALAEEVSSVPPGLPGLQTSAAG